MHKNHAFSLTLELKFSIVVVFLWVGFPVSSLTWSLKLTICQRYRDVGGKSYFTNKCLFIHNVCLLFFDSLVNVKSKSFTWPSLWRSSVYEKKKCLWWFLDLRPSVANVHLTFFIIVIRRRESRELDWFTVKSAQVDQAGCLCAAEVWNSDQENFLSTGTCWQEGREPMFTKNILSHFNLPYITLRCAKPIWNQALFF